MKQRNVARHARAIGERARALAQDGWEALRARQAAARAAREDAARMRDDLSLAALAEVDQAAQAVRAAEQALGAAAAASTAPGWDGLTKVSLDLLQDAAQRLEGERDRLLRIRRHVRREVRAAGGAAAPAEAIPLRERLEQGGEWLSGWLDDVTAALARRLPLRESR